MQLIKIEPMDDDQCTQAEMAEWPPVSTPTSPLDLSMKSKTFKFVHPPTPEQTMMQSPMACLAKIDANKINMPQLFESLLPKPEIVIQPKTEWHYRNIRDLANKHIPLLSGDGPQRTPIRIRVPKLPNVDFYLSIRILDIQGNHHQSKVIIPAKTSVKTSQLGHENNLDCLEFEKCNPNDSCLPWQGHIISRVSIEEQQLGYKDVRICMFNLYQNSHLTKEIIETNKLHLCQLSFQFIILLNNQILPISDVTLSERIAEKRNTTTNRNSPVSQAQVDYSFNGFIIPVIPQHSF